PFHPEFGVERAAEGAQRLDRRRQCGETNAVEPARKRRKAALERGFRGRRIRPGKIRHSHARSTAGRGFASLRRESAGDQDDNATPAARTPAYEVESPACRMAKAVTTAATTLTTVA